MIWRLLSDCAYYIGHSTLNTKVWKTVEVRLLLSASNGKANLKRKFVHMVGPSQGTSRLQSYFSEFCLVLSSFSLRLMPSSENMMVSGGRKEASYLWFLFRGPLLVFSLCLIGQDWVTGPFPNPSLDGSPGRGNEIDYGWFRPSS